MELSRYWQREINKLGGKTVRCRQIRLKLLETEYVTCVLAKMSVRHAEM